MKSAGPKPTKYNNQLNCCMQLMVAIKKNKNNKRKSTHRPAFKKRKKLPWAYEEKGPNTQEQQWKNEQ